MKKIFKSYDIFGNIALVKFSKSTKATEKRKFAQKLLNGNKSIKTVLEKSGKFKGRLRKQETKFIAGEKTKEVLYRENDCVFRFNIDKTYFSPRLSNERKEIASLIRKKDKVLVMFAGAAPFSVAIARKSGAQVYSNEINKEANKYGRFNAELNKVKDKILFLDGDIKKVARKILSCSHLTTPLYQSSTTPREIARHPSTKNLHSLNACDINLNVNAKQNTGYFNSSANYRAQRDKLLNTPRYFDVIVMPRPQLKDSFLQEAFVLSKKGTKIFYYDFCKEEEIKSIAEKIKSQAKKARMKIKIVKVKKAGEIGPYRYRVRIDFIVL
ncbi:hypothetical protein HY212_07920 [Candidatus Pacearchaeota archaeon]|nr:hypothetical protein [Candidatus Pacearchaeota archaeon]